MKNLFFKSLLALIPLLLIFTYNVLNSYRYDSDFGRDIVDMLHIAKGDLTLIGPKLSFGGIHTGPYYYYLFAPVLLLSNYRPEAILVANAILFFLGLVLASVWLQKIEQWSLSRATISLYLIALSPFFIFSARGPGNAFSYIPLMLLLLISHPWIVRQEKLLYWVIYGLLAGIVVNTHLVTSIVFFSLFLLAFHPKKLKQYGSLVVGGIASYAPIFLFELRHNFVIFKNTFIHQSYKAFTDNTNLPNPLQSSANPIENFSLLLQHFSDWSGISFIFILILILVVAIKTKSKSPLVWGSILSMLILTVVARSQLAIHYFFPFVLAGFVALIFLIKSRLALLLLILAVVMHFPIRFYSESPRKIDNHRQFVHQLLQSDLGALLNKDSFNLFVVRETPLAVLGWEYRYFLELNGYTAKGPSEYKQSDQLLIIDETGSADSDSLQSWELSEFGTKTEIANEEINEQNIFLFAKKITHYQKRNKYTFK